MFKEKLAIIIATKDRHNELNRLLKNISEQEFRPRQIIIVDGGRLAVEKDAYKSYEPQVEYIRVRPASLTVQRNIGVSAISDEITLVCFFDDDIVLEENCLINMMNFWESASEDIAGASFNNTNDIYKKPTFIERLFLVNADKPGRILASGFQSKICSVEKTMPVEWLAGYAMAFKKYIFKEFRFDEWFSGYSQ